MSESSLKRWADDGHITVSKTAGGHRRIPIGEAIRFIRAIRAPLLRPDLLGLGDAATFNAEIVAVESAEDRLFAHLAEGRASQARALILSKYLAGHAIAEIADGPIRVALDRLGELWRHDVAGVFVEHRATEICLNAVYQLRVLVEAGDSEFHAVGGAPPGDPYALPTLLAAVALSASGWQAVNLGPNTPFNALLIAAEAHRARLVWLSISSVRDSREIELGIDDAAQSLGQRGAILVIGGRAVSEISAPVHANVRIGDGLGALIRIANEVSASAETATTADET